MRSAAVLVSFTLALAHIAAASAQPLPTVEPEKVGLSSERLAHITKTFAAEVDQGKLPGVVIAVARRGRVAYFEAVGFQDKAAGMPMAKDSIFRVYSMTKPWASVAAMQLVEQGRLQLTDPVSRYLPAFKGMQVSTANKDPASGQTTYSLVASVREPTVQDLLRHTSGLTYEFLTSNDAVKKAYEQVGVDERRTLKPLELVQALAKAPLASQPGTTWEYSVSTDLLGRVVESVAGIPLSQFLDDQLFRPLRMIDSSFSVSQQKAGRIAQPLDSADWFDPTVAALNDLGGEGGLSTAADYLRFGQMLLNSGQLEGKRILSRSTVALMTSDHLGTRTSTPLSPGEVLLGVPGYTFGLGFAVRTNAGIAGLPGSAGEFMWGGAGGTFFWIDPKEELVAVFMSQGPWAARVHYRRLVKQLVYAAIDD